ncbi:MAG: cyclic pyranopterin monophosphate synthase MoaC [Nitrospiraceae bacterium]|nr:MAG: cyclic pyranopterin monophosphate synthase MoaC [Nitrospiraceae bacterium]
MKKLTHIDSKGKSTMVDVSDKSSTQREAMASGSVHMKKETLSLITSDKIAKGNVFETARLAGIMAAKKTSGLIPLCHQLNLSSVHVDFRIDRKNSKVNIEAKAKCTGQTGVEMEALTAVSVAALTIYDMCKAVDKGMIISDIKLMEKRGGKSGDWKRSKTDH